MKASRLIKSLMKAIEKHGDLNVVDANGWDGWGHWMLDGKVRKETVYREDVPINVLVLS